jgi:hypothetical protein
MSKSLPWRSTLGVLLGGIIAMPVWALSDQQLKSVQSAAHQAHGSCLKEMHHDTDEFVSCVDQMRANSGASSERRLGLSYLGLVGCMSAARISTLHSDVCSRKYLVLTDRLIKQLRAKDTELCNAVPGDCNIRLAQIKAMRSAKSVN